MASDFEIAVPSVERVAQSRRGLGRSLVAEHALVPGLAGEPVSLLARFLSRAPPMPGSSCRRWFLATWFPSRKNALCRLEGASRYGLWIGVKIGATRHITLFHRTLWSRQATFHRGPLSKFASHVIHQAKRSQPFRPFHW